MRVIEYQHRLPHNYNTNWGTNNFLEGLQKVSSINMHLLYTRSWRYKVDITAALDME